MICLTISAKPIDDQDHVTLNLLRRLSSERNIVDLWKIYIFGRKLLKTSPIPLNKVKLPNENIHLEQMYCISSDSFFSLGGIMQEKIINHKYSKRLVIKRSGRL